jgi:hypothetical protein
MESTLLLPFLSSSKLTDKIKSLLLTLEHHVLAGTASDESLDEDDGSTLLVLFKPSLLGPLLVVLVLAIIKPIDSEILVNRGVGSQLNVLHDAAIFLVLLLNLFHLKVL